MNWTNLKATLYLPPPRKNGVKKSNGYLIYLRFKAGIHSQGEYKDPPLVIKCVLEALRYRRPDFAVENIPNYFLSHDEFLLINNLAIAVRDMEGLPAAIDIWQKLKENYNRNYTLHPKENLAYLNLVMSLAIALKQSERYEECLCITEEGCNVSLTHNDVKSFSRFLYQRAFCMMKLGQNDEGRALYKRFLMFAYALDGYANISFDMMKKEYEDEFGEVSPVWTVCNCANAAVTIE